MKKILYVGMDVHLLTIAIVVMNKEGKILSRAVIETSTQAVRDFFAGLRGEVHVTFEEGTLAAWLYDVVEPLVDRLIVCNPKHNKMGRRPQRPHRRCNSSRTPQTQRPESGLSRRARHQDTEAPDALV